MRIISQLLKPVQCADESPALLRASSSFISDDLSISMLSLQKTVCKILL